jgi:outer membrane protein insertion porin family/translocation and assembly module TamA
MHLSPRFGRTALVVLASAFAAPILAAQASRKDVAPAPEVRRLELNGVASVAPADIEANIATTATRCISAILAPICRFSKWRALEERHYLDRTELKRDVLRIRVLYYKHGFRETQVDTAVVPLNEKTVAVRFDIVEGPPTVVTDVAVGYDSTKLSPKKVQQLTLIKVGEPLDLFKLDSSRVGFENELWELGHADALVDTSSIVNAEARTARVQFRLVPNHVTTVGDVMVTGTEQVSPTTVLNTLTFRPGDLYRRSAVIESQRNLYESSLFKLATIDVPQTFDSVKAVNVAVREAPLHEARLSLGFNTVDFVQTDARYTAYNLFGGARRLELAGALGNLLARSLNGRAPFREQTVDSVTTGSPADFLQPTWQTSATLTQPAFLRRPKTSASIGAFAQRRAIPAVVIDRGYGGQTSVTEQLGYRAPASLAYRFEVTRVEASDPYFCVNFGVCDTLTISTLRSHQRLSPLTLSAQSDRTDQPLSPTRGYTARAEVETAGQWTVSDYAYNRFFAEGTLYSRLGQRSAVFASHIRLGFVRPLTGLIGDAVLHPRKRFYAGGANSVRGFGENQLGPRILTLPHQYLVNAKTTSGAPCDPNTAAIRFCDPNTAADSVLLNGQPALVDDTKFTPRPIGGTSLLEGSVEYRFPLPFGSNLGGAVFVDGAAVGERVFDPLSGGVASLQNLVHGKAAVTPGFGVRYYSAVGPIRVDVGFNPSKAEDLPVVSEIIVNGQRVLVPLDTPRHYSPTGSPTGGFRGFLNRFVLHLSIGQAY